MQNRGDGTGHRSGKGINKKKRAKSLFSWLKFLMSVTLLLLAIFLIAMTPVFDIQKVEIHGNIHYEKSVLTDIAGIRRGENGFRKIGHSLKNLILLRDIEAEKNILKNCHYVKEAAVRYVIPGSIEVILKERTPTARITFLGTSLLIDNEGYIIDTLKGKDNTALPEIKGLKFDYYELGKRLPVSSTASIDNAIELIGALSDSDKDGEFRIMELVNSIDVGSPDNFCIFIDSRIVVNIGDMQELDYKIKCLKQIYFKNIKKEDRGMLDFSKGQNPIFKPE